MLAQLQRNPSEASATALHTARDLTQRLAEGDLTWDGPSEEDMPSLPFPATRLTPLLWRKGEGEGLTAAGECYRG